MPSNPETAAEGEKQAIIQAQRSRKAKGPQIALPGGVRVDADEFIGEFHYDFQQNKHIDDAEALIKDPKPGWFYAWPKKSDKRTQQMIRTGRYVIIMKDELKPLHDAPLTTHEGATGDYVMWYDHILVGIPAAAVKELYTNPSKLNMKLLAGQMESWEDSVQRTSKGSVEAIKPTLEFTK